MNGILEVIFDMDGCMAGLHEKVIARLNERLGRLGKEAYTLDTFSSASPSRGLAHIEGAQDLVESWLKEPGFYRDLAVIEGSQDLARQIVYDGHQVSVATSYGDAPGCVQDKAEWLDEHFPFLDPDARHYTKRKLQIRGDLLIEDSPYQVRAWKEHNPGGCAILHNRPYNNCEASPPGLADFEVRAPWVGGWGYISSMLYGKGTP